MKRFFATLALALAAGAVLAAPVPPAEARKPAAFPAGHYVLCGAPEAARGSDVFELTKAFRPRAGHYVLSGGPKPTDTILADDDLTVSQGDTALFVDDDQTRSTETRGKRAAQYQGWPLLLVLDPSKKLHVVATDYGDEAALGALWLHRWDGARKKLTAGTSAASNATLPHKFFAESFALADGFEMPEGVKHEAAFDLPAKPAALLPRFKNAPFAAADEVKSTKARDFLHAAIATGLVADGVEPALAKRLSIGKNFVEKCQICAYTQAALVEYGKREKAPAPAAGRGLTADQKRNLNSDDLGVRREAMRVLLDDYVAREFVRQNLPADTAREVQGDLETMRKAALQIAKGCPVCDGACRIPPKP